MDETVELEHVGWRREHARGEYVGRLAADDDGIRLWGRDAATEIEVGLRIPAAEIAAVRPAPLRGGEPCVVLELRRSTPVHLRALAAEPDAAALAAALAAVLDVPRPVLAGC